jgi:hypothetical protein
MIIPAVTVASMAMALSAAMATSEVMATMVYVKAAKAAKKAPQMICKESVQVSSRRTRFGRCRTGAPPVKLARPFKRERWRQRCCQRSSKRIDFGHFPVPSRLSQENY